MSARVRTTLSQAIALACLATLTGSVFAHGPGHGLPLGPAGEPPAGAASSPPAANQPTGDQPAAAARAKQPPLFGGLEAPLRALAKDVALALKSADASGPLILDAAAFKPQLDAFTAKAAPFDSVHITGFEVRATLWFGIVPVRDFDLFFWLAEDRVKLLRYTLPPRSQDMFRRSSDPEWKGPRADAFMQAINRVVDAGQADRCWQLEAVTKKDLEPVLPAAVGSRRRAISSLMRHAFSVRTRCSELRPVPFNRVTFRFGPAGGVLLGKGVPQSFRFSMGMGSDGEPKLSHLNPPVAPGVKRHRKRRGMKGAKRKGPVEPLVPTSPATTAPAAPAPTTP